MESRQIREAGGGPAREWWCHASVMRLFLVHKINNKSINIGCLVVFTVVNFTY